MAIGYWLLALVATQPAALRASVALPPVTTVLRGLVTVVATLPALRAQRATLAFAACQQQRQALHQREARSEGAVSYADECRFSRQAPVPYAWQRRPPPPVERPAVRGRGGGSVLGCWQAAMGTAPVVAYQRAGRFTADLFALAVDECSQPLTGPTVGLDNASMHKAHLVQAYGQTWADRGRSLLLLPAYSPQLNRIEIRWHRCKHY